MSQANLINSTLYIFLYNGRTKNWHWLASTAWPWEVADQLGLGNH